jgi:SAM-dependent methyltransferase
MNSMADTLGGASLLNPGIREMLEYFAGNEWFTNSYWPENEPRVRLLLTDLARLTEQGGLVFEPGCGNGFISFLASRMGYSVTATDAWHPEDRDALFKRANVRCFASNLNAADPWPELADGTFDAILFGEVFEHLLNHPVGLLRQLHRVLKPGGVLLLTTPNPSTLANALRVLFDRHSLWGTEAFASTPKIVDDKIIDQGDIHYREYRAAELRSYLSAAGFDVEVSRYMYLGSPAAESTKKRVLKRLLGPSLMHRRLFASSNYLVARRP